MAGSGRRLAGHAAELRILTTPMLPVAYGDARWDRIRRTAERAAFVNDAGWADADVAFLAGDASARRYFRLNRDGGSAVLMDTDAATLAPYLAMTGWLAERGFTVPRVYAADRPAGLALIEDFGDAQVARIIDAEPARIAPLYERIAEMLARLASYPPAPGIMALDGPRMAEQVGIFAQHYPPAIGADADARAAAAQIAPTIAALHAELCAGAAPVTSLRDAAENIILTPDDRQPSGFRTRWRRIRL